MSNTLETLQASLLELSKQDTVHYEVVANQLEKTRLAILQIEGVEIDSILEKKRMVLSKEIARMEEKLFQMFETEQSFIERINKRQKELEVQALKAEIETEQ